MAYVDAQMHAGISGLSKYKGWGHPKTKDTERERERARALWFGICLLFSHSYIHFFPSHTPIYYYPRIQFQGESVCLSLVSFLFPLLFTISHALPQNSSPLLSPFHFLFFSLRKKKMQSGFNNGGGGGGGGLPDFYTGGLRSTIVGGNTMNNHHPSQTQYHRSQLPGLFMDPTTSQIGRQTQQQQIPLLLHSTHNNNNNNPTSLIGKRTLAEFQFQQQQQKQSPYQQNLTNQQNLYLRSLKPRTTANLQQQHHSSNFHHSSPISPIDFSSATSYTTGSENSSNSSTSTLLSQRYGLPLLQQLRPQPIISSSPYINNNTVQQQLQSQAVHTNNNNHNRVSISTIDSEKKMIDHTLQELEKQLLDDNDEDEETGGGGSDAVSVITKTNSEWSETMQNLMGPNNNNNPATQKPVSPSPTSSSSSSSSVASPVTLTCSKQSLMEAAAAISEGKTEAAAEILTRLTQVTTPRPNSEQRLLEFMAAALKSRVNPVDNPPPVKKIYSPEHSGSTQILYELSPCFRLGFMAANLAILEATLEEHSTTNKVHVIDFDIGQGRQYVRLLHALSTRQSSNGNKSSSTTVKITTVPDNNGGGEERLRAVRQNLIQVAEGLGVGLEFNVVSQKLSELSRESLGVEPAEPIAVNFAFKLYSMPDESVSTDNPRDELLRRVKSLDPRVVTLVEQELNTNTAPFMARVNESCAYYGALLESIENSSVAKDSPDRVKAEEALSRKFANSVACEGRDRVERCEVFGKWRARMGMAGFVLRPMGQNVTELLKNRLSSGNNNNRVHPGFTIKEENGGISFGWISRTLTVASAWR